MLLRSPNRRKCQSVTNMKGYHAHIFINYHHILYNGKGPSFFIVCKAAMGCRWLPISGNDCKGLHRADYYCRKLLSAADGCLLLPRAAEGCRGLLMSANGCRWVPIDADDCRWLTMAVHGCRGLPTAAKSHHVDPDTSDAKGN